MMGCMATQQTTNAGSVMFHARHVMVENQINVSHASQKRIFWMESVLNHVQVDITLIHPQIHAKHATYHALHV